MELMNSLYPIKSDPSRLIILPPPVQGQLLSHYIYLCKTQNRKHKENLENYIEFSFLQPSSHVPVPITVIPLKVSKEFRRTYIWRPTNAFALLNVPTKAFCLKILLSKSWSLLGWPVNKNLCRQICRSRQLFRRLCMVLLWDTFSYHTSLWSHNAEKCDVKLGNKKRNILELMQNLSAYIIIGNLIISTFSTLSTQMFEFYYYSRKEIVLLQK